MTDLLAEMTWGEVADAIAGGATTVILPAARYGTRVIDGSGHTTGILGCNPVPFSFLEPPAAGVVQAGFDNR